VSLKRIIALAGLSGLGLSACTGGSTGPLPVHSVNPITSNVLEVAVGTANIGTAGANQTGMNVVATLRQANGESGALVNTPHLTGPFTFQAALTGAPGTPGDLDGLSTWATGPSSAEISGHYIGGTPQTSASNVTGTPTTFGQEGGVFGDGFAPANYTNAGPLGSGNPWSYAPYDEPLYAGDMAKGTFTPWGGVPAFDPDKNGEGVFDGNFPAVGDGQRGIPLGFTVFDGVTAGTGTYTLSTVVPTSASTNGTLTATSTVSSATLLPAAAPPVLTFNGDGTVTAAYTLPAGVTGAYVEIEDIGVLQPDGSYNGWCNGSNGGTVPYTFWVTSSGTVTVTNSMGPSNTAAGHEAVCTSAANTAAAGSPTAADTVQAVLIGFDFNEYAFQYNGPTGSTYPQSPALPAQADLTMSAVATYDEVNPPTLSALKRQSTVKRHR